MTCVLVVNKDSAARTAIRAVLEREGFEVVVAGGDAAAVAMLETTIVDAVIFDIAVPGIEGLAPIRILRERAAGVPIVAIAPQRFRACLGPDRDLLDLAAEYGAACGLYKPLMPRDLVNAVATCVGDRIGAARSG